MPTEKKPRCENLWAWMLEHDSHGLCWDTICFLPAEEKPEDGDRRWVRASWLDSPVVKTLPAEEKTMVGWYIVVAPEHAIIPYIFWNRHESDARRSAAHFKEQGYRIVAIFPANDLYKLREVP